MTYTVTRTRGCIVVDGKIPISDIAALVTVWSERDPDEPKTPESTWVLDGLLAEKLGVNLVCGALHDTLAWRRELDIGASVAND